MSEWVTLHRFTVLGDLYETSPNKLRSLQYARGWAIGKAKDASRVAARRAWQQYGDRCFVVPVRLSLAIYRPGRRLDELNAWGGAKWLLDELFSALDYPGRGFTPTDGPTWVSHGPVEQVVGKAYETALAQRRIAGPCVVVTVDADPALAKRPKLDKRQRERVAAMIGAGR
jgi:hypothetical protein